MRELLARTVFAMGSLTAAAVAMAVLASAHADAAEASTRGGARVQAATATLYGNEWP